MTTPSPAGTHLLLLDDDERFRSEVLEPGLRDYGFSVVGVGTVAALYEVLRAQSFDVAVLDVNLPDGDGLAVAAAVRAMLPGIGIVMLTGQGDVGDQVRGLSGGADAYLVKPASVELLAATVRSLLRRLAGANAAPPPRRWQFSAQEWCLLAPNGCMVPVTSTEQRVMARLCESMGQLVTREQLIQVVAKNVYEFDPHRIEMVIHRLRRKVLSRCGEALPLTAVHGKGYVLREVPLAGG